MAVKIIIKRKVAKEKEKETLPLFIQLRAFQAIFNRGEPRLRRFTGGHHVLRNHGIWQVGIKVSATHGRLRS